MFGAVHESGYGPKRTSQCAQPMSAFEGKADIAQTSENVRLTLSGPRRGVYLLHTAQGCDIEPTDWDVR
jgi:hypothetical protein